MYCGNLAGRLFVLTTNIIGLDPRMSIKTYMKQGLTMFCS